MGDEEKAEEYASKKCANCIRYYCKKQNKKKIGSIDCCNEYLFQRKHFLAGLAEGRKELEQWKQEWQDAQIKANEEGFARTTLQIKYSELEKENEGLKEQLRTYCHNCTELN